MSMFGRKGRRSLLVGCLLAASAFMILGHAKIMATGKNNCGRGVAYELCHHYVSDYAKHPEHGWMIKTAIGLFCVCIAIVLRDYGTAMSAESHPHRHAWLILLGLTMVGGLLLVALYDNRSMTWWAHVQDGVYAAYKAVWLPDWKFAKEVLGVGDRTHDKLHDAGFALFALGFVFLVMTAAWIKRSHGQGLAKKTLAFLLATTLLILWASCLEEYMPGIPQRTLLLAIAAWLAVCHFRYTGSSKLEESRVTTKSSKATE